MSSELKSDATRIQDESIELDQHESTSIDQIHTSSMEQESASIPVPQVSNLESPTKVSNIQSVPRWKKALKSLSLLIWGTVIILVLLQFVGRISINHIRSGSHIQAGTQTTLTVPTKVTPKLDTEISASLDHALANAQSVASKDLDIWVDEMIRRVDPKFLDWYFNYFTQLGIGLKGIWINLTVSSEEQKAEKLIESFQREFTKQVFQPKLAQLELERMTRNAAKAYMSQLSRELAGLQSKYAVPQADWDRYLSGISYTIFSSEGSQQDLNLRDAMRGGGYLLVTPVIKAGTIVTTKIAPKIALKTASKAATKVATKTATKVAAKTTGAPAAGVIGLELIDPLAGLGILVWDIWDHYHTVKVERPILKENIEKYLLEVKSSLLENSEGSIMSSIYQLDNGLRQKFR